MNFDNSQYWSFLIPEAPNLYSVDLITSNVILSTFDNTLILLWMNTMATGPVIRLL